MVVGKDPIIEKSACWIKPTMLPRPPAAITIALRLLPPLSNSIFYHKTDIIKKVWINPWKSERTDSTLRSSEFEN